jgi:hypothetical protein
MSPDLRSQMLRLAPLAEAERVSLSYVSRILRLTLLAPDIVERILDWGPGPPLAELMQPFPVGWEPHGYSLLSSNSSRTRRS